MTMSSGMQPGVPPNPIVSPATLQMLESTGIGGFPLVNGTPQIFQWTAPNDANMHRVMIFCSLDVASAQTGGAVTLTVKDPGLSSGGHTVFGGGLGAGSPIPNNPVCMMVAPGTQVTLAQATAQTAGAATLYAELWGS
jgi:hypothetical protein